MEAAAGNVDELIGTIGDNIFVRNLSGALAVIDLKSGERTGTYGEVQPVNILTNTATDRIYMLSDSGAVQCLKPIGADLPTPTEKPAPLRLRRSRRQTPATKPSDSPFDPNPANDPFAPGADPFGAGGAIPLAGAAGIRSVAAAAAIPLAVPTRLGETSRTLVSLSQHLRKVVPDGC